MTSLGLRVTVNMTIFSPALEKSKTLLATSMCLTEGEQ
jgi:hypothetical protein